MSNFLKKKRRKKERKNFIDILFHLSNQNFVLNQFSCTSPYRTEQ